MDEICSICSVYQYLCSFELHPKSYQSICVTQKNWRRLVDNFLWLISFPNFPTFNHRWYRYMDEWSYLTLHIMQFVIHVLNWFYFNQYLLVKTSLSSYNWLICYRPIYIQRNEQWWSIPQIDSYTAQRGSFPAKTQHHRCSRSAHLPSPTPIPTHPTVFLTPYNKTLWRFL